MLLWTTLLARSQGTFFIDQQSTNQTEGSAGLAVGLPMGQSFTPTFSSVSYLVLFLFDGDIFHNAGGTVLVNLRSNSVTGTILGTSAAVFVPDEFFGLTNFVFSTPVAVTPGVTYYFQPVIQSGSLGLGSILTDGSYTGGSRIVNGSPQPNFNLWFQEGIIAVPEPSSALLALLGSGVWLSVRRRRVR